MLEKTTYTYILHRHNSEEYKIGMSRHPLNRIRQLQTGNGEKLILVGCFHSDRYLEKRLHRMLGLDRRQGEWFCLDDNKIRFVINYLKDRYEQIF